MTANRGLEINATLFATLVKELGRRGGGVRESGAFLLAKATPEPDEPPTDAWRVVTCIAYYDDLDPHSLTGDITFGADGYTALGVVCRTHRLHVVGDIHTHPRSWVDQSSTDAAHPMAALKGHIAVIAPGYAQGVVNPSDLGAHVFSGTGQWTSYFDENVTDVLRLTGHTPVFDVARLVVQKVLKFGGQVRRVMTRRRFR